MDFANYIKTCHSCLLTAQPALSYLSSRGITQDSISAWRLGYDNGFGVRGMQGRIILPVMNELGTVIGVTGRSVYSSRGNPKYLHSTFPKSRWLYGLHFPPAPSPILVEGHLDAILLRQVGYPALAVMGSAPSLWQAAHLKWFSLDGRVIVYPDRDKFSSVGEWVKQLKRMGIEGIVPEFAYDPFMPDDADPDWLVRNNLEFLQEVIEGVNEE